jgi:peroxiredoxin
MNSTPERSPVQRTANDFRPIRKSRSTSNNDDRPPIIIIFPSFTTPLCRQLDREFNAIEGEMDTSMDE